MPETDKNNGDNSISEILTNLENLIPSLLDKQKNEQMPGGGISDPRFNKLNKEAKKYVLGLYFSDPENKTLKGRSLNALRKEYNGPHKKLIEDYDTAFFWAMQSGKTNELKLRPKNGINKDFEILIRYLKNKLCNSDKVPDVFNEKAILHYIYSNPGKKPKNNEPQTLGKFIVVADKNLKKYCTEFFCEEARDIFRKLKKINERKISVEEEAFGTYENQKFIEGIRNRNGRFKKFFNDNSELVNLLMDNSDSKEYGAKIEKFKGKKDTDGILLKLSSILSPCLTEIDEKTSNRYAVMKKCLENLRDYIGTQNNLNNISTKDAPFLAGYINRRLEQNEKILNLQNKWEIDIYADNFESAMENTGMSDINACIFPPSGKAMDASIGYALDENVITLSMQSNLRRYKNEKDKDMKEIFAKALLFKAKENNGDVLVIDGVLISETMMKVLKLCDLDWENLFLRAIGKYASIEGLERIILNTSHGKLETQQCVHDFVKYTANLMGYKEKNEKSKDEEWDYEMKKDKNNKIEEFNLSKKYLIKNFDEFFATHWIEKPPLNPEFVDIMSKGKNFKEFLGEQYLDTTYLWENYAGENYSQLAESRKNEDYIKKRHAKSEMTKKLESEGKKEYAKYLKDYNRNTARGAMIGIEFTRRDLLDRVAG